MIEINLNDGEFKCGKCKGNGKYLVSSVSELSAHQHNHSINHNHGTSSYAVETVCSKCNGIGKVDWITNAMGEGKNLNNLHTHSFPSHTHGNFSLASQQNDISFYSGGKEMLKIADDGFYADGNKITDDKDVYKRFHKFLKSSGY